MKFFQKGKNSANNKKAVKPNNESQEKGWLVKKKKKPNTALTIFVTSLRIFIIVILLVFFIGIGAVFGIGKAYLDSTPELDLEKIENQSEASFIYDANGELLTEYYGYEYRIWASLDEIPEDLQNAFIAIEDVRFRAHNGVDFKRIIGAFISNIKSDSVQGASTITQQLIKNRILTPERSYKRKIQEAYLALQLEKKYTKEQILEAYLNTIWLDRSVYGVKAAAEYYFGKELSELNLKECAVLAGMTQNPSYYSPYNKNQENFERTNKRANLVLSIMYEEGFITEQEYNKAKETEIVVKPPEENAWSFDMAYFIEYAIKDVRNHLMQKYNVSLSEAEQMLLTGGYKIYTTLDPEIQKTAEEAVKNYDQYPKLPQNISIGKQTGAMQPQAAAVVMDHRTGEVKALVGGRETPDVRRTFNRATDSLLQIGSTIKPISVYAPALDNGLSPATVFDDIPAPIPGWKSKNGYPNNYDYFRGLITMRDAVKFSVNHVAAETLAKHVGVDTAAQYLINMGIDQRGIENNLSGLSLGTSAMSPLELAGAFSTIANKGVYQQPITFTRVEDKDGKVILDKTDQIKRVVMKETSAFMLNSMLEDVVNSGTGTNVKFGKMPLAGKTGTNEKVKGVLFAGYSPYYTSIVWIGHDDNESLPRNATGGRTAGLLWRNIMKPIHEGLEPIKIYEGVPEGIVRVSVCSKSGKLPTDLCSQAGHVVTDYFLTGTVPREKCDYHIKYSICSESGKTPGEFCPEESIVSRVFVKRPSNSPYFTQLSAEQRKLVRDYDEQLPETATDKGICDVHTMEWWLAEEERKRLEEEENAQGPDNEANPEEEPGTDPGKDPGTDPGSDPGTDPGSDPGTGSGNDPGANPGANPGNDPGAGNRKNDGNNDKKDG
ncbi:MAG TPA: PBP1A family penicillin-binding protein [Clostridiales bacterium]|nr:PBP1A family penicillin-binding protein [Clostridiales bacterium]